MILDFSRRQPDNLEIVTSLRKGNASSQENTEKTRFALFLAAFSEFLAKERGKRER
jgi:hypothetical protein